MKYSYTINGEAQTVVMTKTGTMLEVRRGDLTGSALQSAGQRTWGSEAEWKAEMPTGTVITRSSPRLTSNPRLNQLLAEYDGLLRLYDNVNAWSEAGRIESRLQYLKSAAATAKYQQYYEKQIDACRTALQTASTQLKYYRTCHLPIFYCDMGYDKVTPVFINRRLGLMLCCIDGKWAPPPIRSTFWIPNNNGYRKVVIDDVSIESTPITVHAEPLYIPSPFALSGFDAPEKDNSGSKRVRMWAGLAGFLLLAYQLHKP